MKCECGGKLHTKFNTKKNTDITTCRIRKCIDCGKCYHTTERREEEWTNERKKST